MNLFEEFYLHEAHGVRFSPPLHLVYLESDSYSSAKEPYLFGIKYGELTLEMFDTIQSKYRLLILPERLVEWISSNPRRITLPEGEYNYEYYIWVPKEEDAILTAISPLDKEIKKIIQELNEN